MADPLSFIILYAILTVASSISSNVASSGIFEILKPKIFKNKDSQEVKEALQEIIENLKENGYEKECQEIHQKMEEITEKTIKTHENIQDDLAKMREEFLTAITQNTDETMGNKEAIDELKRIFLEYDLPEPFLILTKEELSKDFVVPLRPPFRIEPIERPIRDSLVKKNQNMFIIGKPGIGKTLLLYQIAERLNSEKIVWVKPHFSEKDITRLLREDLSDKILLVWDDIQNNADVFYKGVLKLIDKFGKFKIICAARSTELEKIEDIPVTFWKDFNFLEKEIPLFKINEKMELIRRCSEKGEIHITDEVARKLAKMSDGTPLYIISVFLDERYNKAKKILMGDIRNLPENVVDLWERYFQRLKGNEKALLRCLMILSKVGVRGVRPLLEKFYIFNGNTFDEFLDAVEVLERQLWVVKTEYGYDCHDVQLEAVPFGDRMLDRLKKFILNEDLNVYHARLLNFGISIFHYGKIPGTSNFTQRMFHVGESIKYTEISLKICRDLGLRAELSMSLNNASNLYSGLASLQQTREERLGSIQTAVKYIEEAIEIYRDLGLRAELSSSLNNASSFYSGLASLQQTREERLGSIQTAVKYIEEAIEIRRDLGLRAELSSSLNNASNLYSGLASLQQTREERLGSIQTAVKYIEEAIEIYRDLGLRAELSSSLNNASSFYSGLASLQQTREERLGSIQTAVKYIEEAIEIYRDLRLVLDLADSLAISVFIYDSYLEFDSTVFSKAMVNCDESIKIFLEFGLKEKYCPLLSFGIKYHQIIYSITKLPEDQAIVKTYQQLLNQCQS